MFSCSKCQAYESEIQHLREMNKNLSDKLMALANPRAYQFFADQSSTETYSNNSPEIVYDAFGSPVFVEKKN